MDGMYKPLSSHGITKTARAHGNDAANTPPLLKVTMIIVYRRGVLDGRECMLKTPPYPAAGGTSFP